MVSVQILPYLRPAEDLIIATDWKQIKRETEEALPARLEHWDPATPVMVRVGVQADVEQIWQTCKLAENDQLRLALLWSSTGTNLRGRGDVMTVHRNDRLPLSFLTASINGTEIADEIKFELQLVLADYGSSSSKLAPHRPGSILWRDSRTVKIGGEGSRFPVDAINFADQFQSLPEHAVWFLDWDPTELEEPFLRSVRLFLNTGHQAVRRALNEYTKENKLLLEMVHFDVSRAMITAALSNEEFVQHCQSYKQGTVGSAIYNMICTFFPHESVDSLAGRYHTSPARVECELQASFKLFKKEV